MSEMATPPTKKRRWRKPAIQITTDNIKNEESSNSILGSHDQPSDLLQPEMLSDVDLVCRLNEYHVPVDSNCSRDELVELFSKHVMPKPQRKRRRQGQSQVKKLSRVEVMEDSLATTPCNNGSLATTHNHHDAPSSSATGSGDTVRGSGDTVGGSGGDTATGSGDTATGSGDNKDSRIIIKRKQNNNHSPPHRKKAFIRNDITWP